MEMKKSIIIICALILTGLCASGQRDTLTKLKLVIGAFVPELAHAGLLVDLGKHNQLGVTAGIGPTWGGVWPSFNAEHRLYFGSLREKTKRRLWFFRQSIHYFPAGDDVAASLSAGLDLRSGHRQTGWTIDAGMSFLINNGDRYRNSFPCVRFQFYNYFKKAPGNKGVINSSKNE
jgi:hypothetical protein